MRTFHSGGVALGATKQPEVKAKNKGVATIRICAPWKMSMVTSLSSTRTVQFPFRDKDGLELESYNVVIGSVISVADGGSVKKNQSF